MKSFHFLTYVMVVLVAGLFTACDYKELCYDHHHADKPNLILKLDLKLDIDIDIDIKDGEHTEIKIPSHMVVCFYDTLSGALKKMTYVGPYGGPLQVNPGTYDMVVYSFDTEWTQVRGESNRKHLEAFTSDITNSKSPQFAYFFAPSSDTTSAPGPIIYTPDHLLVTRKRIEIPQYSLEELVITIEAVASTVVETYGFEVTNITGIEYISTVEAFITNQSRSSFFGRGELNQEPATIYFPMEVNRDSMTLKTAFNTFGKLPGESRSYLNLLLTDEEGNPYTIVTDITDQFGDSAHTIVIQDTVVIPPPSQGGSGIAPTVEEWEEENHDVQIG